jgi:murein DD-endopeptidase MepM/ murein hydrolase activator NlpD
MNQRSATTLVMTGLVPVAVFFVLIGTVMLGGLGGAVATASASCQATGGGATVDPGALPAGAVAGYSGEQLVNAALIMNAGAGLGLSVRGQTIGVMTAMGESTLRVLDRGDLAGPDSRGLFQQRDNGAWGSYADRMDPTISATNFFRALQRVTGWEALSPTAAAHAVQRNADPSYYTRFWDPAGQVVAALTGVPVETLNPGGGALACTPGGGAGALPVVPLPPGAWTKPAVGPLTSVYGMRWGRPHNGIDIAPPCSAPIYAAAAGTVVGAGPSTGYGNLITVDHGGGVVTRYAHMYPADVLTAIGQTVVAGQQIARVGSYGDSTGCHLHFEVLRGGAFTDPIPVLAAVGVSVQ